MQKANVVKMDPPILKSTEGTGIRRARHPVVLACEEGSSMTKQSFKDECNINKIIAKYRKTGAIDHVNKNQPQYGYATSNDFREAMEIVQKGQRIFDELPANVRAICEHDPAKFLEFVQDQNNSEELVKLGLATAKPRPTVEEKGKPA